MMTEKELIGKIRELRQIKPNKDWVILTKSQILGEEDNQLRVLVNLFRPAYAGLIVVFVLFGLFGFAQNSLPGDILYPIKKITEKSQAVFVSEKEKPKLNLELANKRLEELNQIAEKNEVKKLAPAINEYQASVSEAAKNLVKLKKVDREIIEKSLELAKNKEKAEKTLGINIGNEETEESLNDLYKTQAEYLINDFKNRTLTDEQKIALEKAEKEFDSGNYLEVLTILISSQPQE
jgi:NADH dehydrogenase/NADH:ubiquinone oxidoreductase subunit G